MLKEYFSLEITVEGMANSLPLLMHSKFGQVPTVSGPQVNSHEVFRQEQVLSQFNWNSEWECFFSFLRELAHFYVPSSGPLATVATERDEENVFQPAFFRAICQSYFRPSSSHGSQAAYK